MQPDQKRVAAATCEIVNGVAHLVDALDPTLRAVGMKAGAKLAIWLGGLARWNECCAPPPSCPSCPPRAIASSTSREGGEA